jgi:tripartite-type tricarboxylate transporter receptor subunit TctC
MRPTFVSRRRLLRAGVVIAASFPLTRAFAQTYPSRSIRIVVPWAPGGLVDFGGRVVGDALSKAFNQAAVVEDTPGAAGTLGADLVAHAAPDGYTLLMGTSSIAIDVAGGRKLRFDPLRDLTPVALVVDTNNVVIVPADSPLKSIKDVIDAAKAKPGELTYGTPGIGSPAHLFTELFAQTAGIRMLHVPYGRAAPMNDLLGHRLQLMFATIPAAMPQVKGGTVRALAVTGAKRHVSLPEVPTIAEAGLPGYEAGQWLGVFAPGGTPSTIVQRLNAEISRAVHIPATAEQLKDRGMVPLTASPEDFARILRTDVEKWRKVLRAGNIRLE